jgi:hypothetical protein
MTTLQAIHFPETILSSREITGQLLLFDTISYIIPTATEDEPDPLCPAYDPAPLGEDANRFEKLLDELKGNETAFYQGQMSTLALEYLETRDDDTVRDIIKAVHGEKTGKRSPEQQKKFEQLWQARLLLKLAEIMRREEQDVHDSLQRLKDAQKNMLGDLKGEEEFQDLFKAITNTLPKQLPVRVEALIKAWGRLFMAKPEDFTILHCYNQEAAEPFLEVSEAIAGQRPTRILQLALPECPDSTEEFLQKKEQWQKKNEKWLTELKTTLQNVSIKGLTDTDNTTLASMADQWNEQIKQTEFQLQQPAPPRFLEIYLLEENLPTLLAQLCSIKNKTDRQKPHYTLLAFIADNPDTCS